MPDDDLTVLVHTNGPEPVWFGYHDGDDGWRWAEGGQIASDVKVTHWAQMPEGPN